MAGGKAVAAAAVVLFGSGAVLGYSARGGGESDKFAEQLGVRVDAASTGKPFDRGDFVFDKSPALGSRAVIDLAIRQMMRRTGEDPDLKKVDPANRAVTACGIAAVNGVGFSGDMVAKWNAARNMDRIDGDDEQKQADALFGEAATLCTNAVYTAVEGGQLKDVTFPVAYED